MLRRSGGFCSETLNYQFSRAATNFKNVLIEMWYPELDTFTRMFYNIGNAFGSVADYFHGHTGDAKAFADLILAVTGMAGARFMLGVGQMARLAITMPASVDSMVGSLNTLTANIGKNAAVIRAQGLGTIYGPNGQVLKTVGGAAATKKRLWRKPLVPSLPSGWEPRPLSSPA